MATIRLATDNDFDQIFDIWIEGIASSFDTASFNVQDLKTKFQTNFLKRGGIFNYWVATEEEDKILGWVSLNKTTVNPLKENFYAECSTYINTKARKVGLGELLVDYVMKEAKESQLHYVIGFIGSTNEAIRKIAADTGWIEIGELPPSSKIENKHPKVFMVRPL